MSALRRNPILVLGFLGLLVYVQVKGTIGQFQAGFMPFRAAPTRVPFSWDMFSIEISRCDVQWDPKLPVGHGYRHFSDFGAPIEWDPVYNVPQGYLFAAFQGCQFRKAPTRVALNCVTPQGPVGNVFECP
jgi:hypothetical protein